MGRDDAEERAHERGRGDAHGHDHSHDHRDTDRRRLAIAFAITASVLVAELVGAWITGSLALLTDAAHMVTDSLGLLVALTAATLVRRPPTARRTWGMQRMEVVAATVQAVLLLGVGAFVVLEAIRRIGDPPQIPGTELLVFGVVGLAGNLAAMAVLAGGRARSLNLRAAFLEVLGDALGAVAVIVAAVLIVTTGFGAADTIAAILIGVFIIPRALMLLWDSAQVVLEAVPKGVDLESIREHLESRAHVIAVHDLHVSRIASDLPVLTAHVVVQDECFQDGHAARLLGELQACVAEHFPVPIEHSTFQLEPASHAASEHGAHA